MTESFASCVIVAAGKGERFGDAAKVVTPINGRSALSWSLDAMEAATTVRDVVLVIGEHTRDAVMSMVARDSWPKVQSIVDGGASRQASMAAGVSATDQGTEVILVHDGARPLVTAEDIDRTAEAAREYGVAILASQVTDTIKRVKNSLIDTTIDRSDLWAAHTPQAAQRVHMVRMAELALSGTPCTDEASLAEALGLPVRIVEGHHPNFKLTRPEDIMIVEALLHHRRKSP